MSLGAGILLSTGLILLTAGIYLLSIKKIGMSIPVYTNKS